MNSDRNPTLPLAVDLAWMGAMVVWLLLVGAACVSILRSSHRRRGAAFWWCLLVLLVPIFGALIWFVARPRTPESITD
jgi:lysylphosphatidylglycerol synthetase-like protein (DUF2156 family)